MDTPLTLYMRFQPSRLTIKIPGRGLVFDEDPTIAIDPDTLRVVASGRDVHTLHDDRLVISNEFNDKRVVIGDVDAAEIVVRRAIKNAMRSRSTWLVVHSRPRVIVHPLHRAPITEFERRGLEDMALRCGARRVLVWSGHELSDAEIERADLGQWRKRAG